MGHFQATLQRSHGVRLRYRIVDVFSDRPLAGNGLCVVLDPCPERLMAPIAREVNLSETTFAEITRPQDGVQPAGEGGAYAMRIFTPSTELPFAGHPSLGTAWTLGPGRWAQTTSGATVVIEADELGAVMAQPDPTFEQVEGEPYVRALGLPAGSAVDGQAWLAIAGGMRHLIVPTEAPIDELGPDMAAMAADRTTAIVRRRDDRTLQVRVFVAGIGEDPGTGSAAGPIGVLARRLWGTDVDVTIHQGDEIGRPCRIEVHAEEGAIRVGGRVTPCAEGTFLL